MRITRPVLTAIAAFSLLLLPTRSDAAPVTGILNMSGDATTSATLLTFLCDVVAGQPCPANYGDFLTSGAVALTGSFVPYAGDTGYIHSLSQTAQPLNANFLLQNFLVFNPAGTVANPDIALDLTFIFLGTGGQADCAAPPDPNRVPAQTCTPTIPALVTPTNPLGLSAFTLANTPTGSTASFVLAGNARRISTGELSPFTGTLSATFTSTPGTTDKSYQALLSAFAGGGSISSSYSTSFNAIIGVPEPATTPLVLGAMLIFAGAGFRKFHKNRQA
jgi:hypothetical protein